MDARQRFLVDDPTELLDVRGDHPAAGIGVLGVILSLLLGVAEAGEEQIHR